MKKRFLTVYSLVAVLALAGALARFAFAVSSEAKTGAAEAEKTFSWISREATQVALSDGFMSDAYIAKFTDICRQSRLLSAVVITTPAGAVFAWPDTSKAITYDMNGAPKVTDTSLFMKVFSANLDIGDGASGSVVMTAVIGVLKPDTIFAASRFSFLIILALLLVTLILIVADSPSGAKKAVSPKTVRSAPPVAERPERVSRDAAAPLAGDASPDAGEPVSVTIENEPFVSAEESPYADGEAMPDAVEDGVAQEEIAQEEDTAVIPEGLFSPVTGCGWEQYLPDRLEAELVRAASSEQDLSLIIIRVSGLAHTDLLARRMSSVLLETFKFRDMVFEYGSNGFAGILQNVNLDQAMKVADSLYAGIDSILIELGSESQITIGITTRTARLLPAARMIEEAESAARKAVEEPSLPIVAFRANPEKYRNFVADTN